MLSNIHKTRTLKLGALFLFAAAVAQEAWADFTDAERRAKGVVALYNFAETTGDIIDSSGFGTPLNLSIQNPGAVVRSPNSLLIDEPTLIVSKTPATKIINECKRTNEFTVEVWLENTEARPARTDDDEDNTKMIKQPVRIVTLSKDTQTHNFTLAQGYNMGGVYKGIARTSVNESNNSSGALIDPIQSDNTTPLIQKRQRVVFTRNSSGVARLYVSDSNNNTYEAVSKSQGFAGSFANWHSGTDIFLGLGNEISGPQNYNRPANDPGENRAWRGRLFLVAIYCRALSAEDLLGASAPRSFRMPSFPINLDDPNRPSRKRAAEIHLRLSGIKTPLDNPILEQMADLIDSGDAVGAAALATDSQGFYNITTRDFAARMSNRDETVNSPLNDFTTTVISAIRDDMDARTLLSGDYYYQADPTRAAVPSDAVKDILTSNNHYQALGSGQFDLSSVLTRKKQILYDGSKAVANPEPAGLLTTRAWMEAHAIAGTNRRLIEYTFRQFLCIPIEKWADSTGPDALIGPDIDRFPGGSHDKFTTTCRACHSVMDSLRGAFAHYTFSNGFTKNSLLVPAIGMNENEDMSLGMKTSPAYVALKMNHNDHVFPGGRKIANDNFKNYATKGINANYFGWGPNVEGTGVRQFGQMISGAKAFPRCMAHRVYRSVCKREPASFDEKMLEDAGREFASRNFDLKYLFQRIVVTPECLGK